MRDKSTSHSLPEFGQTLAARFWSKVDKSGDCWLWTASTSRGGYGKFGVAAGCIRGAHRVAYELVVGPIPAGLTLDHLCRTPACVNPAHLEPVTQRENNYRSPECNGAKTHCKYGHPYDEANTRYAGEGRYCRACDRDYHRIKRLRQRRVPD